MTTAPPPSLEKPNRREFLYYLGGASLALLGAGSVGVLARFLNPPVHYGVDSRIFLIDMKAIPKPGSLMLHLSEGLYFLSQTNTGLLALDPHCTFSRHRDTRLYWSPSYQYFVCPRCGSKFKSDGSYIEGPVGRYMDRFIVEVTTPNGIITTPPDGAPISIEGATQIVVDTNRVIYGKLREA